MVKLIQINFTYGTILVFYQIWAKNTWNTPLSGTEEHPKVFFKSTSISNKVVRSMMNS